jgi:hypothetical protein
VVWVEVLRQHKRHTGVGGRVAQKGLEGGKAAGRGTDADDKECGVRSCCFFA